MAITKCKECGKDVSSQAAACPNCGAPVKVPSKNVGCLPTIIIILAAVFVLSMCTGGSNSTRTTSSTTNTPAAPVTSEGLWTDLESARSVGSHTRAKTLAERLIREFPDSPEAESARDQLASLEAAAEEHAAAIEQQRLGRKWTYHSATDDMTGRVARQASIRSENTIELDFPYRGAQRATLTVRDHPRFGKNVIFRIERGQLLCRSRSCQVLVRFDDAQPQRFDAGEPSDNSSELLFIRNHDRFVRGMRGAKVVRISAEIYQSGQPVFEFHVGGYSQERFEGGAE